MQGNCFYSSINQRWLFLFINIILDCLWLCLFHAFINKDHVFLWQCCFYSFKTFFLASNFSLYFLVCLFISKYLPSIMFQKTCFSTKWYNWISIELSLITLFFSIYSVPTHGTTRKFWIDFFSFIKEQCKNQEIYQL